MCSISGTPLPAGAEPCHNHVFTLSKASSARKAPFRPWSLSQRQQGATDMKRYVIERNIPGVGGLSGAQLKEAAVTSCNALSKLYGKVQWEHSYVVDDKTFCIYLANDEPS